MHGFKSFAKKTELPFTEGINVILGPNGSGKSNVSDALCFVLGRLSIKSMRAAKAGNLIFQGTKIAAPSKEAMVEMVFDNSDRVFSIEKNEISIKRIVRKNGQSLYKINDETKTRQEVLMLLSQAGIDPNGFNIILQGEIQNFVRMHTDERRKVIEEVSGISVYEMRKEKSLRELDKTEEKLKEVVVILRDRTMFLNNLEREREQALKFKKLEKDIRTYKASIINFDLNKKRKENENLLSEIEKKNKEIERIQKEKIKTKTEIANFEAKISSINSKIQQETGLEQERLNSEIANLRAELAGFSVKLENSEKKLYEISSKKNELQEIIRNNELSMKELHEESPMAKKEKEVEKKKKELEILESDRRQFYMLKSEIKSLKDRIDDKKNMLKNYLNESDFLLKQINNLSKELFDKNSNPRKLDELRFSLSEREQMLDALLREEKSLEKLSYKNENEIENQKRIVEKISKMDVCPVCKSKITSEHLMQINREISPRIVFLGKEIENSDKKLKEIYAKKDVLKQEIEQIKSGLSKTDADLVKLSSIDDKKEQIKVLHERIEEFKKNILEMEKKGKNLEVKFVESSNIEQKYERARIEVQDISLRTEENLNSELSFKKREMERAKVELKQLTREEEEFNTEYKEMKNKISRMENELEKKRKQEEELSAKFEKLISDRDKIQKQIRESEMGVMEFQNKITFVDSEKNNLNIDKARIGAEIENFENEMLGFPNVEIIKIPKEKLVQKLSQTQEIFSKIGSVNLRSLEVYDEIKQEYDSIKNKVEIIEKEKESILKIIHEIDIKKKKTFVKTLDELNDIFTRNFSQLSIKGQVTLELENKKEPFEGGVGIIVKTGHGKYFDVTSLSGGEQTLVALSLIFAIQELKPYCFYILDEIDAALDKRNSNRLAGLLKKYMTKGQYIVITHNDEVISEATNLYGISMHDGISKIISLKL